MDDQFFTKLREIQRKERANSSLARVGSDFYIRTHKYLDSIRDAAVNDPFSQKSDLLKNVQRIATEICELREHKIANAAIINIHRSYHLFQGKPQFDLLDTTPLNITEEEEKLYFSLIDVLKNHRRIIYLDQLNTTDDEKLNDSNFKIDYNNNNDINNIKDIELSNDNGDKVLDRLKNIKSAKVIEDEPQETIEKQIANSKYPLSEENIIKKEKESKPPSSSTTKSKKLEELKKSEKPIKKPINEKINKDGINNLNSKNKVNSKLDNLVGNEEDQFVDLNQLDSLDSVEDNIIFNDGRDFNNFKSRSTVDRIANVAVLIFSEINSIIGVDKKIYGPFNPQDIVIMPDVNAEILIKNKKGRLIKV